MEKNKKGRLFDIFAIFIAFLSLFFNILLLYNIKESIKPQPNITQNNDHTYSKKELGEYFKNYQSKNNLAIPDNIVLWDIDKVTYRGFFKNSDKKLYYITERFSCITGDSCITTPSVSIDSVYDYSSTFVVSIDFSDPYDLKFEILDYSIENNIDFVQDEIYDLE